MLIVAAVYTLNNFYAVSQAWDAAAVRPTRKVTQEPPKLGTLSISICPAINANISSEESGSY